MKKLIALGTISLALIARSPWCDAPAMACANNNAERQPPAFFHAARNFAFASSSVAAVPCVATPGTITLP
jgi:hypothetical protein